MEKKTIQLQQQKPAIAELSEEQLTAGWTGGSAEDIVQEICSLLGYDTYKEECQKKGYAW